MSSRSIAAKTINGDAFETQKSVTEGVPHVFDVLLDGEMDMRE